MNTPNRPHTPSKGCAVAPQGNLRVVTPITHTAIDYKFFRGLSSVEMAIWFMKNNQMDGGSVQIMAKNVQTLITILKKRRFTEEEVTEINNWITGQNSLRDAEAQSCVDAFITTLNNFGFVPKQRKQGKTFKGKGRAANR